jgi:predicted acyl esterase
MITERDIMVPMRDGVRIAVDIYRPAPTGHHR